MPSQTGGQKGIIQLHWPIDSPRGASNYVGYFQKKIKSIFKGHLIQFLQPTQGNFYNLRGAPVSEVGMWLSLKEQS